MGPFKVLCLFLFLLGYISTIIAVPINSDPTPPTKNAFPKPLFNVKQGPSTASGCDSRLSILAEAYTEAIKMVDQAVQVLNYINEPGPEADNPAQWSIDEYFVLSMFRIQMDYKTGEVIPPDNTNLRNDADGLKRAQDVFNFILDYAYQASPPDSVKKYLACTNDAFKYLNPTDKHPLDSSKTLNANGAFPDGGWFLPGDPATNFPDFLYIAEIDTSTGQVQTLQDAFCDFGTEALTLQPNPLSDPVQPGRPALIIFCDEAFNDPTTIPISSVQAGQSLTKYRSVSTTWVHELTHAWAETGDMPAVDDDKNKVVIPHMVNGQWEVTPRHPTGRDAYEVENCMALAINHPDEAIENGDNYAMFAAGIWLRAWQWGAGGIPVAKI